jgi:hypothetical protein
MRTRSAGDVDVALGPGRLKLIGLDRFNDSDFRADSIFVYDDGSPSTGSRFAQQSETSEIIGRAEYRWNSGRATAARRRGAFNAWTRRRSYISSILAVTSTKFRSRRVRAA